MCYGYGKGALTNETGYRNSYVEVNAPETFSCDPEDPDPTALLMKYNDEELRMAARCHEVELRGKAAYQPKKTWTDGMRPDDTPTESSSSSSSEDNPADDQVLAGPASDRCSLSMDNIIDDGVGRRRRRGVRERLLIGRAGDGTPRLTNFRLVDSDSESE